MQNAILTPDQLRRITPSVFAAQPWERMGERYRFLPTIEVVNLLAEQGFHPVKAQQNRCRIPGKASFTKHLLRFRHADYLVSTAPEVPEVVLVNSHDGSASYRFMVGIMRCVCMNGLIVASADFGSIAVRHSGGKDFRDRIVDATGRIVSEAPNTMEKIETWKGIILEPRQQIALATAALELKDFPNIKPDQLLATRREEDKKPDLWTTTNVVQENLLKGGLTGRSASGRRSTTRSVKSVSEDLRLNRALWVLTEKLAETVG